MRMYELIMAKRDGRELSDAQLADIISGFAAGDIPNYQMSALLMSIFFKGLNTRELATWTRAMIASGEHIRFDASAPYVDKHSTGGVGDKISLPLAPLAACLGVRDPMISGRGLGHTGGTLDKLEAIPGFTTALPVQRFKEIVDSVGCAIVGQTSTLVPADKMLYALRDVTATVDSIALIASSILSKKVASGISGLVMDVKVGSGAFMKTPELARELASTLVSLGSALGLTVTAFLTDMGQPLGVKVGNALEIEESVEILRGEGPPDSTELVLLFASAMQELGGLASGAEARRRAQAALDDGRALAKFGEMIEAQGGDRAIVDDTSLLPRAGGRAVVEAETAGYVAQVDCQKVGLAVVALGGGRRRIEDVIDPAVGLEVHARIGDKVEAGQPLVTVHYNREDVLAECLGLVREGILLGADPVAAPVLVRDVVRGDRQ